jgi:hypothetical protein
MVGSNLRKTFVFNKEVAKANKPRSGSMENMAKIY